MNGAAPDRVSSERFGAVAEVTIDDPQRRNALTDETLSELSERIAGLDADDEVRCIVVVGSEKVFASGADIRALLARTPLEHYTGDRARLWDGLRRVRTPLVAAVSGFALGGGCELALLADVVVASETARFGLPETGLGLIPGAGGTQTLPRAIGKARSMDMILTGRMLTAHEAEQMGLVSRVVSVDKWLSAAREVATEVASRPAVAQLLAKEAVNAAFETGLQAGIAAERRLFAAVFSSDDAREGLIAFLEKRNASWRHR